MRADEARQCVGASAGREPDQAADGLRRIVLRVDAGHRHGERPCARGRETLNTHTRPPPGLRRRILVWHTLTAIQFTRQALAQHAPARRMTMIYMVEHTFSMPQLEDEWN